jgi:hypothetical protein
MPAAKKLLQKANSHPWLMIFPHFPLETGSAICRGNRLPAAVLQKLSSIYHVNVNITQDQCGVGMVIS